jgi:hypothetical protein
MPQHIFYMPNDKPVALALEQVLTLFNQEIKSIRMSGIFCLPAMQEPILIIWSSNCRPTQERDWLMKFDEAIDKNWTLNLYLVGCSNVRNSFVNYLMENGATYLSLQTIACDYFLSAPSRFKPQPIQESEQISVAIKRNLGHGLLELKDYSKRLSNILPWLEAYLRRNTDATRTSDNNR